jgi:hypothetical protein
MAENMNCQTMYAASLPYAIKKIVETVYEIHGNVHLWPYVNYILL